MTDNIIQLKKDNIVRLEIETDKGEKTGEYLEFDLDDIELPLTYQEMIERDKKNRNELRNKFIIINKKEDHKGKKLFSSNEEEKIKAVNEFFKKEVEIYNMFLGDNGVQKLLNGRKLGFTTLAEIDEIIEKYIAPKLDVSMDKIEKKIREKYSIKKEDNILE